MTEAEEVAQLERDLPRLRAQLQGRQQTVAADEAQEAARAGTPLCVRLEALSCEFATLIWQEGKSLPVYQFQRPCLYGKAQPDQDCRDCAHRQYIPYGKHLPAHEQRYSREGMILPVADEVQAGKLLSLLHALEMRPLRRPHHEVHALKEAISRGEKRHAEMKSRMVERVQGKR